jgi:glutamyl-tRNA synthetase
MATGRMPPRVRIAPSPTGDPHVGTAYVALFNRAFARRHGGQFLLRIEDTDRERSTRESEVAIFRALRWLGLDWDEGPDVGGPCGPYRQSERSAIYAEHGKLLLSRNAAYRCFCTEERLTALRAEQKARKASVLGYDGHCRTIPRDDSERRAAAGEPFVVRLLVPKDGETRFKDLLRDEIVIQNTEVDDQVLLKTDGFPTYHLANVVDDHLMGITHVMRAEEWIPSTPKHVLLYRAFDWEPPVFCHLPLLRNSDKTKISKRKNPTSIDWYRENGYLPEALVNFLSLMGWYPKDGVEVFPPSRFVAEFEPQDIKTTGPVFDLQKLSWLNGEYIRLLDAETLAARIVAFEREHRGRELDPAAVLPLVPLVRERLKTLADFESWTDFFFSEGVAVTKDAFLAGVKKLTPDQQVEVLKLAHETLRQANAIDSRHVEEPLREAATARGYKVGDVFMCLRLAVTGKAATPPLVESMAALGRDRCLARIAHAIELLA